MIKFYRETIKQHVHLTEWIAMGLCFGVVIDVCDMYQGNYEHCLVKANINKRILLESQTVYHRLISVN